MNKIALMTCLLVISFVVAVNGQANAQTPIVEPEKSKELLDIFFAGGAHHVIVRHGEVDTMFYPDQLNFGIRLIDLRFLEFPEIQKELELSEDQLKKLVPLFKLLAEYDSVWKWELACRCQPVKKKAFKSSQELKSKVNEDDVVAEILLRFQRKRLKQLQRRFLLSSLRSMPKRYGELFLNELSITRDQKEVSLEESVGEFRFREVSKVMV
jgi:hypothetical protein